MWPASFLTRVAPIATISRDNVPCVPDTPRFASAGANSACDRIVLAPSTVLISCCRAALVSGVVMAIVLLSEMLRPAVGSMLLGFRLNQKHKAATQSALFVRADGFLPHQKLSTEVRQ